MPEEATVYIVDDDAAVRDSIAYLVRSVDLRARTFSSATDFLREDLGTGPGCIVLDIRMPRLSGLELQRELAQRGVDLPIIFVSGHGDLPTGVRAMKAGAQDFLEKPFHDQDLLDAVHDALRRERLANVRRTARADVMSRIETLTRREREVLSLVVAGLLNKQIGMRLGASEKTIKVHRARVMKKMGADSLPELVRMADLAGICLPEAGSN